jgi:hypothetical protein
MKRLGQVAVAAALALGVGTGCTTTTEASKPDGVARPAHHGPSPCDYYPLQVGARWTYDGPPGPDGKPQALVVTITGRDGAFFVDDHNGHFQCDSQGLRDDKRYLLQGPVELGKKWQSVVAIGAIEHAEITQVGATVAVPAGSFHDTVTVLAHIRIDAERELLQETTYAPGVGIIRFETRTVDRGNEVPQIGARLRSFVAAAPAP